MNNSNTYHERLIRWKDKTVWYVLAVECKLNKDQVKKHIKRINTLGIEKACGDIFIDLCELVDSLNK